MSCTKTLAQIAAVHVELSHYDQAMSILLKVERCQLASVGKKNRDLLETRALIGRVLSVTGKYEEAFEKLKSVAERQSELFGLQHPPVEFMPIVSTSTSTSKINDKKSVL